MAATMTSNHPNKRTSGFSLVEFLMVALILGVGLLGLTALTTMAIRGYGNSRTRDVAAHLASSVLDRLTLDGRLSAALRENNTTTFPAGTLVANASDNTVNAYVDPNGSTNYDIQGLPTTTTPIFKVSWVRRAPKSGIVPTASSQSLSNEVVVNVWWVEAQKNSSNVTTTANHYLSISRSIRY